MHVTLTMRTVLTGPPNQFSYVRPNKYHGIISCLPLPVIDEPFVLLHPVASYIGVLNDLDRLATVPGTNADRLQPVRRFIVACIQRGPDMLPDLAFYTEHSEAVRSANIANVYFYSWACAEPEVRPRSNGLCLLY